MLFNSLQFALFFVAVLGAVRALPRRGRIAVLLASSLLFYALWYPPYLLLLLACILVHFVGMRWMLRSRWPGLVLALATTYTLGQLAWFKYAVFLAEALGIAAPGHEIFLPLGISFYSFQILALTVDVYRGQAAPPASLARYALFVCFFPQLIAGPIVRGHELLPQLEEGGSDSPERTRRGLWLVAAGLLKKVVLGDFLLAPFVDPVFSSPGLDSGPIHLIALYSFAFQIYCDFSGYTDIARGLSCLLGFELPRNFEEPYLSRNPAEFWRRWHVTLSQWLRDYLYIPLGGNRGGAARTALNLVVTMLLGGLWHGASWNFVVWGGLHGVLLVAHRVLVRGRREPDASFRGLDALRAFLLFQAVCVLWVFFRTPSFDAALRYLKALATGDYTGAWPLVQLGVVLFCALAHVGERVARSRLPLWQAAVARRPWAPACEGLALGAVAALVLLASRGQEFIYFQF